MRERKRPPRWRPPTRAGRALRARPDECGGFRPAWRAPRRPMRAARRGGRARCRRAAAVVDHSGGTGCGRTASCGAGRVVSLAAPLFHLIRQNRLEWRAQIAEGDLPAWRRPPYGCAVRRKHRRRSRACGRSDRRPRVPPCCRPRRPAPVHALRAGMVAEAASKPPSTRADGAAGCSGVARRFCLTSLAWISAARGASPHRYRARFRRAHRGACRLEEGQPVVERGRTLARATACAWWLTRHELFGLADPSAAAAILLFIALCVVSCSRFASFPSRAFRISPPDGDGDCEPPGAAPAQLETEVTRRVENAVATWVSARFPGDRRPVGHLRQFHLTTPLEPALDEVRDAITRIRIDLPRHSSR